MKLRRGLALVEVIVGFAITAMGLVAVMRLVSRSTTGAGYANRVTSAGRYATEAMDWIKGQASVMGWTDFKLKCGAADPCGPVVYCLNTLTWPTAGVCVSGAVISGTEFAREVTLTSIRDGTTGNVPVVKAEVIIRWREDKSGEQSVKQNYEFVQH